MDAQSLLDDVMKLPEGPDKRDLEWCATVAEWHPMGMEVRAINIAMKIAIRLLNEKPPHEAGA